MNPSTIRARTGRLLLALALSLPAVLATVATAAAPPVLDRELFFGNPDIAGAQLSPDGKYIAFLKPWKDTRNVWVKKTGEAYDKAHLVTADPKRPIPGFFWTRDSRKILFVQDKDGDENYNVYAVDPAAAPEAGKDAPPARNLTDAKGARAMIYAVPKADPDTIFVGLNDRDAAWHDLYKVKISTGERTLVRKNTTIKVAKFADMLSAMGTEPRLRIMQLLLSAHPDGLVVGDIQSELDIPNSTLSHHLEKLKNEELVNVRRESTFLRYTANTEALQELLQFLYAECCTRNKAVKPQNIVQLCK